MCDGILRSGPFPSPNLTRSLPKGSLIRDHVPPGCMIDSIIDQRYRIVQRLGEGAMGEVFLVENVGLSRREALKILRGSLAAYPDLVGRFRREARAINRLNHPNIVALYELGALPDGRLYMAMEYAEGASMATVLKSAGSLPASRALR